MIKIGDFAKIFDVSIKTVRFYEEKGLITPAYIDIYTGYRYYNDDNIKEMCNVLALKDLGLELKEIKNVDNELITSKIKEYEENIEKIKNNIKILKTLSIDNEGEMIKMTHFINDEKVIGKWQLVGISNTKEEYLQGKLQEDLDYRIKELYLMEGGQKYWVISWSKDIIYINDRENPYEIDNDLMFVKVMGLFDDTEYKIAVYKKIDDKKYTIDDIRVRDNTDLPFEKDDKLVGFYKAVDYVRNIDSFSPNEKYWKGDLYLEKMSVSPDGDVTTNYKDERIINTKYTKGYIINLIIKDTLCKYELKEIDGKTYMFVEWKSGDYVFGKFVSGYYVLEKIN